MGDTSNSKRPEESVTTVESESGPSTVAHDHPDAPIEEVAELEVGRGDEERPPTPRFIQEEGDWKRWKWVPYPVRRLWKQTVKWAEGPREPKDYKIQPLLPQIQHAPLWLLDKYLPNPWHRIWLLFGYIAVWIVTFALVMRSGISKTEIPGFGEPWDIGCGNTFWGSGNSCGLDGSSCRPFNDSYLAFRCPANCASYRVLNPRAVGDQEIIYQPLVIGGPPQDGEDDADPVYRGDSFICGAALHAGVVDNGKGGCGLLRLIGTQTGFVNSTRNGISSIPFDSYFPLSYTFEESIECESTDPRWALLAVNVVFTTVLSLFTTSPAAFFFINFTALFWQVGMASDPPSHSSIADLFSNILGKYLPAMFTAWVMFDKMGVRRTLDGLTAQVEKAVLWLGPAWVGALTNYTFDFIPIQRLTPHDLEQQPGAIPALVIIIVVLLAAVVSQVWFFRQEGRLIKYLKLYLLFVGGIIICLVLPDLSLRIHHYILALLLLPGTSMQTRPSLIYQGLLIGLFVNGIARWDWDPFLQTAAALQNDAQLESPLPDILTPIIVAGANASITFRWGAPPGPEYDGISVLVNDVERQRTYFDDVNARTSFVWQRREGLGVAEYFRFAYMEGTNTDDYTRAGVWTADGGWVDMEPGPSKVRRRGGAAAEDVAIVVRRS